MKSSHTPSIPHLVQLWPIAFVLGFSVCLPAMSNAQEPCFDEDYIQNPFGILEPNVSTLVNLVDIDHDDTLEAFVSLEGTGPNKIHYYENSGSNTEPQLVFQEADPFGLHVGGKRPWQFIDIDGDGLHEVFLAGSFSINDLPIQMIDNTGTEMEPNFGSTPIPAPYGITLPVSGGDLLDNVFPAFVDIDNDGDYDVFITGRFINSLPDEALFFMENKDTSGNGTAPQFDTIELNPFGFDLPLTENARWAIFADMDCDEDFDMYMTTIPGSDLFYFENKGTPEVADFSGGVSSSIPGPFTPPSGDFLDIGGDGDLDLINASGGMGVQFYENVSNDTIPETCRCITVSAQEDKFDASITLSPNPAQDVLQLTINSEIGLRKARLEIFGQMGKKVFTDNMEIWSGETSKTFDISQLLPGFYFLKIDFGGEVWMQKFVKMN